jgi:hypothetical protein
MIEDITKTPLRKGDGLAIGVLRPSLADYFQPANVPVSNLQNHLIGPIPVKPESIGIMRVKFAGRNRLRELPAFSRFKPRE